MRPRGSRWPSDPDHPSVLAATQDQRWGSHTSSVCAGAGRAAAEAIDAGAARETLDRWVSVSAAMSR